MALILSLNGNNYVSGKRQAAFETALQDGRRVTTAGSVGEKDNGSTPVATKAAVVKRPAPESRPTPEGAAVSPAPDYGRLLETVERGLAHSFDHQSLTLRVHEQYLSQQSDYAQIFSQLMAQQGAIFANGNGNPQQADAARRVLDSLTNSMSRFHDIQAETLGVHKQFLSQQAEYSQTYIELLQQQHGALSGGGDNGGYPVAAQPVTQAPVVVATPKPSATVAPAPVKAAPVASPVKPPPAPVPVIALPVAPVSAPVVASVVEAGTASGIDAAVLTQSLLDVVSDKTGYPAEMLELSMDMEADLGIDSIKRVEILGALQDLHPELPEFSTDVLAELRTLGQIVEYMGAQLVPQVSGEVMPVAAVAAEVADGEADETSARHVATLTQSLLDVVSDKTGYPAEMLELSMDMEADLGIDSIKRVEILGALQDLHPELPEFSTDVLAELRTLGQIVAYMGAQLAPQVSGEVMPVVDVAVEVAAEVADGAADGTSARHVATLTQSLLDVVSDKTGYPAEMLELSMDMEADLGIDSIKRVEILGALQDMHPELPEFSTDVLAELRTLGQIVEYMGTQTAVDEPSADIPSADKKKAIAEAQEPEHNIRRQEVRVRPLPTPDFLEFAPTQDRVCLIVDDGTSVSTVLARALTDVERNVVLLRLSASLNPNPQPVPYGARQVALKDMSEASLQAQLATIGPVGCVIYVNPPTQNGDGYFPETEKARLKMAFLMAKHLKSTLTEAANSGRAAFMTVTRMDGVLGLSSTSTYAAVDGGFNGLVKTLSLEWPGVHCRAVDVGPKLDADQAAQAIIAELHDPNRLFVEVGYGEQGRVTLEAA